MAALLLLGRYPDLVDRASIWVPIYDLAELYGDTSKERLRTDMITVLGSAPTDPDDPRYLARSPRSCLQNYNGKAIVFINVGDLDTQTSKKHGYDTYNTMKAAAPGANIILKEWAGKGTRLMRRKR